jgi:hypothetical protein
MAWKPPKKKLSAEKALIEAKALSSGLWYKSKPIVFARVEDEETQDVVVRILDPSFTDKTWLVTVFDPLDPKQATVVQNMKIVMSRYHHMGLDYMTIIPVAPNVSTLPGPIQTWLDINRIAHPVTVDPGGHLARSFECHLKGYGVMLLRMGATMLQWMAGQETFYDFELKLQQWLRDEDPGLPLHDPDPGFFKL